MTNLRIGHGYDVHAFEQGDHIMLGGVKIPHDKGFKAHSDGDVLLHALCDALLGAAALGDIGQHFPDTDPQYENIDSRILLRHVLRLIKNKNWTINNLDCTIIAQSPRMLGYLDGMKAAMAADLNLDVSDINIKATTTERLGFVGREEGIAAEVVVLLAEAPIEPTIQTGKD